jgi:CheY-like chemotaxis protein
MLLAGKSILVVEDEFLVAALLEDMLGDLGCSDIKTASSVSMALDALTAGLFDLVILDVNLDGHPSAPVAEALLEKETPFVFSTGYDPKAISPPWNSYPFLQKPFQATDLEQAIRKALC